jgi:hypothetical protein
MKPSLVTRQTSETMTPIGASIIIKLLADLQNQLAEGIESRMMQFGVAGPKVQPTAEALSEWRRFPRALPSYTQQLDRVATVAASVGCEQAVTELMLRWLPPEQGAGLGGVAFQRSQFEWAKFQQRLKCLNQGYQAVGADKKAQAAMQAEEQRNTELVKSIVCVLVRCGSSGCRGSMHGCAARAPPSRLGW